MTTIKTTFDDFKNDLRSLMHRYTIIAPSMMGGKLDYQQITDPDQILLTDELPYKSAKEAVFPRIEKLMSFSDTQIDAEQDLHPILLIGVKPCDITGFKILDEIFTGTKNRFIDPFYKNRRDLLVLIGMGCTAKKHGCFCDARGIDMTYSSDCDYFLTLDQDQLIIDSFETDKSDLLSSISGDRTERIERSPKTNQPNVTSKAKAAGDLQNCLQINAEESEIFDSMPWDRYIEGCLGCGTCTYLCPTCHCFEFKDTESDGVVSRYRCWDSCMYPKFTLHASGHNPRSTKKERFRQRVMHKFVYIPKNFGYTACTGCGRCVRACPGGVSIRKVVEDINTRLVALRADQKSNEIKNKINTENPLHPNENPYLPSRAQILEIVQETHSPVQDVKTYTLKLDTPIDYLPGQFVEVTIPGMGEAPFGFASSPHVKDTLQLCIKRTGYVTDAFHRLREGDSILLRGPFGNTFPMKEMEGFNLFYVAGGLGLAPLRPLIDLIYQPENRSKYGKIHMLIAARSTKDFVFHYDYDKWASDPNTDLKLTIDNPEPDWNGLVGFPHNLVKDIPFDIGNTYAVLCGPPIMIKSLSDTFVKMGMPKERILTTLEMRMTCGVGKCGKCNIGHRYVCIDGPVFSMAELNQMPNEY